MKIILIISAIIGSVSIWMCWKNPEDQNIAQLGVKVLLIGSLSAFIFIGFELWQPLQSDKKISDFLVLRREAKIDTDKVNLKIDAETFDNELLLSGSTHQGYSYLNQVVSKYPIAIDKKNNDQAFYRKFSLDALEMTFWRWYAERHLEHWQSENTDFVGISDRGGLMGTNKDEKEKVSPFESDELQRILFYNSYKNSLDMRIFLPPSSKITVIKHDNENRYFKIENQFLTLFINIAIVNTVSTFEGSYLGSHICNGKDLTYEDHFKIEMGVDYNRFLKGNPEMPKHKKWATDILNEFHETFDWGLIKSDLIKAYQMEDSLRPIPPIQSK